MIADRDAAVEAGGLTEDEANALVGDEIAYWLGNPFMDRELLAAKVRWWLSIAARRAPAPVAGRGDVGVEAVLRAITDPIHARGCHYRHQQGDTDECNSCTAHRIETEAAAALAPLLAAREREWPCDDYEAPLTCWTTPKPKTLICEGCRTAFPNGPDVQTSIVARERAAKAEAWDEACEHDVAGCRSGCAYNPYADQPAEGGGDRG